jgi:hypothetical protein
VEPTLVSDEEEERAEAARLSDFGGESLSDIESQQATLRWPSAFEEEAASAAPASEAVRDQEQESFQPSRMEESREEAYARAGVGPQINASVSDEALLDLGEIETPSTVAAPEDFILDLQDEAFYHEPQPEETAPRVDSGNAAVVVEEEAKGTMTRAKEFVEGQTIGTGQQFEITQEIPNADVMEAEPVLEAPQAATGVAATGESAVAEPPAARTGLITLDQLSPEVIDAIARRAVEQLSEKVVQEIAWEVVPQLAELLIKRRLEEEKAQPQ